MTPHPADACPVRAKFAAARRDLNESLVEREEEIDLALTALVAGEHLLLVGPPGTAKSTLCDALLSWMQGRKFAVLLTKFSVPEEVFGPVSIAALKEDRYLHVTAGRLPEADVAFVDEIYKASTAILNTLLQILNERTYDPGDGVARPVPLKLCVAAANEWPAPETGQELAALADRFLFRKAVRPIGSPAGRRRLLWGPGHRPTLSTTITAAEVEQARADARALPWSDDAKAALETVLAELAKEGVRPGDRRQFKAVGAARAYAYLAGAAAVAPEHLEVLQHVLWDDPLEQPAKAAAVIARVAHPAGMRVSQLLLECEQVLAEADPRDLAKAATAAAKLGEVERRLAALDGHARADRARAYVREQIKALRLASLEAV